MSLLLILCELYKYTNIQIWSVGEVTPGQITDVSAFNTMWTPPRGVTSGQLDHISLLLQFVTTRSIIFFDKYTVNLDMVNGNHDAEIPIEFYHLRFLVT